jgi:hypothetical protein
MVFRENIDVDCENHTKHVRKIAEFFCVTAAGKYTRHWDLRRFNIASITVSIFNFCAYSIVPSS